MVRISNIQFPISNKMPNVQKTKPSLLREGSWFLNKKYDEEQFTADPKQGAPQNQGKHISLP
jgi:hypothetical protein